MRELRARAFITTFTFTDSFKAVFKLTGMALVARAPQWILQWMNLASGSTCLIFVTTYLCLSVIAAVPSEQTPTQFCQFISLEVMKQQLYDQVKSYRTETLLPLTVYIHT